MEDNGGGWAYLRFTFSEDKKFDSKSEDLQSRPSIEAFCFGFQHFLSTDNCHSPLVKWIFFFK